MGFDGIFGEQLAVEPHRLGHERRVRLEVTEHAIAGYSERVTISSWLTTHAARCLAEELHAAADVCEGIYGIPGQPTITLASPRLATDGEVIAYLSAAMVGFGLALPFWGVLWWLV